DRLCPDAGLYALEVRALEVRDLPEVGEVRVARGQALRRVAGAARELGRGGTQPGRCLVAECRMDAVDDQRVDRLALELELVSEVLRLLHRVAPRRRHEHERGVG